MPVTRSSAIKGEDKVSNPKANKKRGADRTVSQLRDSLQAEADEKDDIFSIPEFVYQPKFSGKADSSLNLPSMSSCEAESEL